MESDKKILLVILAFLLVCASITVSLVYKNQEQIPVVTDAIKFKEEYGKLNAQENETTALVYPEVSLTDTNPFVYKTEEQIVELLKSGTGVIYFGYSTCPWCRTLIPVLTEVSLNMGITEISYLNIKEIRDTLDLDENNQIITKKEGTKAYYEILKILDSYLTDYKIKNQEGEEISTGEKRLLAPTLVTVKEGVIIDVHIGTIDSQESGYIALSDHQEKELKTILTNLLKEYLE